MIPSNAALSDVTSRHLTCTLTRYHLIYLIFPRLRVSVNAKTDVFTSVKLVKKRSKIVSVSAVNNGFTFKIIGQGARIRPLFGL